jgi:2-dehydropantoate 2-reductase
MDQDAQAIAVIGGGTVGSITAAYLCKASPHVIVVEQKEERAAQIREQGLHITGKVNITSRPAVVLSSIEELKNYPVKTVLICTKTWSLKTFLPVLVHLVKPGTTVVSVQNGIGTEDEIGQYFPPANVARVAVNFAGGKEGSDAVTMHWFHAPNFLGPLEGEASPYLQQLVEFFNSSGLTTQLVTSHEIKRRSFFKTVLNSALNALCATSGITMKQAMTYRHTLSLATLLIREGLSVASAVGYHYGESALDICRNYLSQGGDHLPSMWTDLQQKSPTEIEYINGKIVKLGLMFQHVNVDANIFFTSMIITEEIKAGIRKPEDIPSYLNQSLL